VVRFHPAQRLLPSTFPAIVPLAVFAALIDLYIQYCGTFFVTLW
jgi:hypothetical protein